MSGDEQMFKGKLRFRMTTRLGCQRCQYGSLL